MNLRKLAQGQNCMVRIPTVCKGNNQTTVLHHIRMAGITGTGLKANDFLATWICADCHLAVHGKHNTDFTKAEIRLMELEGIIRTQNEVLKAGGKI